MKQGKKSKTGDLSDDLEDLVKSACIDFLKWFVESGYDELIYPDDLYKIYCDEQKKKAGIVPEFNK